MGLDVGIGDCLVAGIESPSIDLGNGLEIEVATGARRWSNAEEAGRRTALAGKSDRAQGRTRPSSPAGRPRVTRPLMARRALPVTSDRDFPGPAVVCGHSGRNDEQGRSDGKSDGGGSLEGAVCLAKRLIGKTELDRLFNRDHLCR
jgi:hypothetical protein